MGFKRMQRLTHDMENVFQEVRSEKVKVTSSMIDLLFKCLDAIEGYLDNVKASSDEGTEDNELIIKELNDFIAAEDGSSSCTCTGGAEKRRGTGTRPRAEMIKSILSSVSASPRRIKSSRRKRAAHTFMA